MITILMATYNGERYIAEQIESILSQTETCWKLIIQDDCSLDGTAKIAQNYAEKYPSKIKFKEREAPSGSAKNNFSGMLHFSDSEYMMTCDQDDVWLSNKLELTLEKMHELEEKYGEDKPLLVHTDLQVVDEKLKVIDNSLFHQQNLDSSRDKFNNLLAQNIVTGCTMMVNHALMGLAGKVPEQAIMHDRWFALLAAALGKIAFVNEPTVLYRQHDHNEIGSENTRSFQYNLKRMLSKEQSKSVLRNTYLQAETFLMTYGEQLSPELLIVAKAYALIPKYGKIKRIQIIHHYDFWKSGLARKCGQVLFS